MITANKDQSSKIPHRIKTARLFMIAIMAAATLGNASLGITAPQLIANTSVVTCSAYGNSAYLETNVLSGLLSCSLSIPQAGYVFISATSGLDLYDNDYEARFRIGIDNLTGEIDTDRFVNVYNRTSNGTDESMALSVLKPISAGPHTFYLLAARLNGSGYVYLIDFSLSVMYIPAPSPVALACGASGDSTWDYSFSSFDSIRQCTLTIPQDGWVFISADGSVGKYDDEFEAWFRLGIDYLDGMTDTDRYLNVYNDSGDGEDRSVAVTALKPVTAGMHNFYFLGNRYSGDGIVRVYDPTLSVIYVPSPSALLLSCSASGDLDWTTTSSSFGDINQCTLMVPQDGWMFISATGNVALTDEEYEADFRIGIDSTSGDSNTDRSVNVEDDSGNGTDKSVAISALTQITAGLHTFYFLGKRNNGTGTVNIIDPNLTVLVSGVRLFLPMVVR